MQSIDMKPSLAEEVLNITWWVSDRCVLEPGIGDIETNLLFALKRFCLSVQRRYDQVEWRRVTVEDVAAVLDGNNNFSYEILDELVDEPLFDEVGIRTDLYNESGWRDKEETGLKEVKVIVITLEWMCVKLWWLLSSEVI